MRDPQGHGSLPPNGLEPVAPDLFSVLGSSSPYEGPILLLWPLSLSSWRSHRFLIYGEVIIAGEARIGTEMSRDRLVVLL